MFVSVALLSTLSYRAVRGWQRSATLLAESRAQQGADLLAAALTRDMRAAQVSLLSSPDWYDAASFSEISHLIAGAFARFAYPEAFFSWSGDAPIPSTRFFVRLDRPSSWVDVSSPRDMFPVAIGRAPSVAPKLIARVMRDAAQWRRFSIFDLRIGDQRYQVVSRLRYTDSAQHEVQSVFGFVVNVGWVRQNYFDEIIKQVGRIAGTDSALTFSLHRADEAVHDARTNEMGPVGRRTLVLAFFDPLLVAIDRPADLDVEQWIVHAVADRDQTLQDARTGARRTLIVTILAAAVFTTGLGLSLRAIRAYAHLAQLRADFVSTVTHELKTPVATIRAAGDTLASHRVEISDGPRKYAHIIVEETKRLTRLVDNLLAYSRITDTTEAYSFRPLAIEEIVGEILKESRSRLDSGGFDVHIDIPPGLPLVRADRTAICLALDNVVDNAIRYSKKERDITISASLVDHSVQVDVTDRGVGIPADEIGHVAQRFFRGKSTGINGSGLGLALARRIVTDHDGSLTIRSAVDQGTTVSVRLHTADVES
jgi:signal transduction histidine kinase